MISNGMTTKIDPPSRVNDRYRLVEWLGEGSMGVVYCAYDEALERQVAIKFLPGGRLEEIDSRFLREARTVARLAHPNIMMIYDVGQDRGWRYLVLEYIPGADLHTLLQQRGFFSLPEARHVLHSALKALAYAHQQGVIHRDIKPENIMLSRHGQVKVTDFGLALPYGDIRLTQEGALVGTALYMAPEMVRGEAVDGRADLYALGAVVYELLTGRPPFNGENLTALIGQILIAVPPPLCAHDAHIPAALDDLVMQLLAKSPGDRFASAEAALAALEKIGGLAAAPASDAGSRIEPPGLAFTTRAAPPSSLLERLVRASSRVLPPGASPADDDPDESPLLALADKQEADSELARSLLIAAAITDSADALEVERARLADLLSQSVVEPLTLLLSQANTYEQTLSANFQARAAVAVLAALARQALLQARDLGAALNPAVLNSLGLEPALEALSSQVMRVSGLMVDLEVERLAQRLPPPIELALFRVAQQVLERLARGGKSSRATIRLTCQDQDAKSLQVRFDLWDDSAHGSALAGGAPSLGAAGQRVQQLGGLIETRSAGDGNGLSIRFRIEPPADLTRRELEIVQLLAEGASNKAMARRLGISPRTVNFHLDNLYAKLGVNTRTEAAIYAIRHGWVHSTASPAVFPSHPG